MPRSRPELERAIHLDAAYAVSEWLAEHGHFDLGQEWLQRELDRIGQPV